MKILFVGDASNLHKCLAQALRDLGHTAIVASNGSHWMNTHRDINLKRSPGKIGAVKYVLDVLRALPKMPAGVASALTEPSLPRHSRVTVPESSE